MMQHDATLGSLKNAEQLRRRTPKMFGTYSLNYAEQLGRTEELKKCGHIQSLFLGCFRACAKIIFGGNFAVQKLNPKTCSVHVWGYY
jgi:hypothetical protein